MRRYLPLLFLIAFSPAANAGATNSTFFEDTEFDPNGWTPVIHIYADSPGSPLPAQSSGSITQQVSGSPFDNYSHSYVSLEAGYNISTAGIYIGETYDPRKRAILSLDYSFTARQFSPLLGFTTDAFPALLQDGRLFIGVVPLSTRTVAGDSWTHPTSNKSWPALTANDFVAIDIRYTGETIHPNFTALGDPIEFGYALTNRASDSMNLFLARGVDDWEVTVNQAALSDLNGDGVGGMELALWEQNYANEAIEFPASLAVGDYNRNGLVDGLDFLQWQKDLSFVSGSTTATTAVVPEPSTAVLLLSLAILGVVVRNRLR